MRGEENIFIHSPQSKIADYRDLKAGNRPQTDTDIKDKTMVMFANAQIQTGRFTADTSRIYGISGHRSSRLSG